MVQTKERETRTTSKLTLIHLTPVSAAVPAVFMILISAVRINSKGQVEPELVIQQPRLLKTHL